MKKIALLVLLIPVIGFSQDCKFEKNEIDPFNKTKVVHSKKRVIVDVLGRSVFFQFKYNLEPTIQIQFVFGGVKDIVVPYNNKIMFLFNDDEVLSFQINQEQIGKITPGMNFKNTEFLFDLPIKISDLEKIKNIGIKSIRLVTSQKEYDFEVSNKKDIEKMNTIIGCFLKELSN